MAVDNLQVLDIIEVMEASLKESVSKILNFENKLEFNSPQSSLMREASRER